MEIFSNLSWEGILWNFFIRCNFRNGIKKLFRDGIPKLRGQPPPPSATTFCNSLCLQEAEEASELADNILTFPEYHEDKCTVM